MSDEKKSNGNIGWGLAILLVLQGMIVTFILQFFGGAWYWPWLFVALLIVIGVRLNKKDVVNK